MKFVFTDRKGAQAIWGLVNHVAAALVARGDGVTFCRWDDGRQVEPPPVPAGVEVVDVAVPPKERIWHLVGQHRRFAEAFRPLLRRVRPDVVHTNFCVPGVAARVLAARQRVPVIVSTQHETYRSMYPHYRWSVRLTEPQATAVVYVSRAVARSFGRSAPLASEIRDGRLPRHVVIPNGIDVAGIAASCKNAGHREPYKLVCSGRLVDVKGQDVLIRAMPRVAGQFPAVRLLMIGTGPRETTLVQLASSLGVSDQVDFTGWLPHDHVLREVATAAVAVVPSDAQEGFGLVVAEAMACQTPIVASRIPVFEELLTEDGRCGLFFKKKSPESLSETICRVLSLPEGAAERAARARLRVAERFSADRMVGDYLRLYDSLERQGSADA